MSKCPFWSSRKENISCNKECPMNPIKNNNETCPFIEHLLTEKIVFKDVIDEEFAYSKDENLDYMISSYGKYR